MGWGCGNKSEGGAEKILSEREEKRDEEKDGENGR